MKSFINKQNLLGLLLVIGSIAINSTNNASQTPTNIEKEFDMLISCALLNPNESWYRKGGKECGKYFLPLSRDKANFKKNIAATDFSEEGQCVAIEFVKKHEKEMGQIQISNYIQEKLPAYSCSEKEAYELAGALQDQIPNERPLLYKNRFLQYANYECECHGDLFEGDNLRLRGYVADEQDQKNIKETVARHKRQTQS